MSYFHTPDGTLSGTPTGFGVCGPSGSGQPLYRNEESVTPRLSSVPFHECTHPSREVPCHSFLPSDSTVSLMCGPIQTRTRTDTHSCDGRKRTRGPLRNKYTFPSRRTNPLVVKDKTTVRGRFARSRGSPSVGRQGTVGSSGRGRVETTPAEGIEYIGRKDHLPRTQVLHHVPLGSDQT